MGHQATGVGRVSMRRRFQSLALRGSYLVANGPSSGTQGNPQAITTRENMKDGTLNTRWLVTNWETLTKSKRSYAP